MGCIKKLKEEIAFRVISRRGKASRRLREVSPREKKLYQFRNTPECSDTIANHSD